MQKEGTRLITIGVVLAIGGLILAALADGIYAHISNSGGYGDNSGVAVLNFLGAIFRTALTPFGATLAAIGVGFRCLHSIESIETVSGTKGMAGHE